MRIVCIATHIPTVRRVLRGFHTARRRYRTVRRGEPAAAPPLAGQRVTQRS